MRKSFSSILGSLGAAALSLAGAFVTGRDGVVMNAAGSQQKRASRVSRSKRFQASPGIFSSHGSRGMPVAPFYQRPHLNTPADRARIQAAQDKRDRKAAKRRAILNKQGILA